MSDWRAAVRHLCAVAWDAHADWMLTGSAAEALHGVRIEPTSVTALAHGLSDLLELAALLTQPPASELPLSTPHESGRHTRGQWQVAGVDVTIDHHSATATALLLPNHGRRLWESRQLVGLDDLMVPVVPLEVLIVAGLAADADVTPQVARLAERGWDRPLLAEALRGQGITARTLASRRPDLAALMN